MEDIKNKKYQSKKKKKSLKVSKRVEIMINK